MTSAPDHTLLQGVTAALVAAASGLALAMVIGSPSPVGIVLAALGILASAGALASVILAVRARRRRSEQSREQLAQARVLSHEIRTPLSIIRGSAELLAPASDALDSEQQEFLRAIIANTQSLQRLVEDLLTQARIDAGLFTIRREMLDFRELMAEIVRELRPLYPVEILLSNLRAPLIVEVDPVLLRQVLNNLVSNCARYSGDSQVLIRVVRQEEGVLAVVSDFGPGMDRAAAARSAGHRHPDSNGIGLRVVRNIMQSHGGGLYLDSTPGFGTSASIHLPRAINEEES